MKTLLMTAAAALAVCTPALAKSPVNKNENQVSAKNETQVRSENQNSAKAETQVRSENQNKNETQVRGGDQTSRNDNNVRVEGDRTEIDALALSYHTQALANLPVANCQGESTTVGAQGNGGLFAGSLGFGKSKVDQQCTLRETIRLLATLTAVDYNYSVKLADAVGRLEGAQPYGEPGKCVKLIYKGKIEKARSMGCTIR